MGISLLVPWSRNYYRRRLVAWFKSRFTIRTSGFGSWPPPQGRSEVIDSFVVDQQPKADDQ